MKPGPLSREFQLNAGHAQEDRLFKREELSGAILAFREYIQSAGNRESLIKRGTPSDPGYSQSRFLMSRLADIYADEKILTKAEADRVFVSRKTLLDLKTRILGFAAEALKLNAPTQDRFWAILEEALSISPKGEKSRFLLDVDKAYLGLSFSRAHQHRRPGPVYSGGLRDMLDLFWHVARELFLLGNPNWGVSKGRSWTDVPYSAWRNRLGDLISLDGWSPRLKRQSYFQLENIELQTLRVVITSKDEFLIPGEERSLWSKFVYRCHKLLGLDTSRMSLEATAWFAKPNGDIVYDSADHLVEELTNSEFDYTPSFHWVLFRGQEVRLSVGERTRKGGAVVGEADIVRILFQKFRGQEPSEEEVWDALEKEGKLLVNPDRARGRAADELIRPAIRDKLDARDPVTRKRGPGNAEKSHLISIDHSRKPPHIRINI